MPTLKVTVGQSESLDERARRRLKAAEAGEDLEDAQPVLNFGTYDDFSRLMSPKNLELLDAIAEHAPESISEAADLVDRDYRAVHDNLSELEDLGVIEFEGGGAGKAKKPTLAYDGIEFDISFARPTDGSDADAVTP